MTMGSLFAGIGGFDLGFTRAGFDVIWQVEIDEWCRRVLAKHFPNAKRHGDIRETGSHNLEAVDVICGGFPCQPFSAAGKRGGAADDRYLWPEMLRVIREVKSSWVVAENVDSLTFGEMEPIFEQVLSDLEGEGYEVQPFIIPACAVDAPHRRYRVWIVAHAEREQLQRRGKCGVIHAATGAAKAGEEERERSRDSAGDSGQDVAHAIGSGLEGRHGESLRERADEWAARENGSPLSYPTGEQVGSAGQSREGARRYPEWKPEPAVGRVANGIPRRVDRLRGLGNAIVPQIAELIANAILETEHRRIAA